VPCRLKINRHDDDKSNATRREHRQNAFGSILSEEKRTLRPFVRSFVVLMDVPSCIIGLEDGPLANRLTLFRATYNSLFLQMNGNNSENHQSFMQTSLPTSCSAPQP
jgi:hypothetical protein